MLLEGEWQHQHCQVEEYFDQGYATVMCWFHHRKRYIMFHPCNVLEQIVNTDTSQVLFQNEKFTHGISFQGVTRVMLSADVTEDQQGLNRKMINKKGAKYIYMLRVVRGVTLDLNFDCWQSS